MSENLLIEITKSYLSSLPPIVHKSLSNRVTVTKSFLGFRDLIDHTHYFHILKAQGVKKNIFRIDYKPEGLKDA